MRRVRPLSPAANAAASSGAAATTVTGPTGPGWVAQMTCYHYYNGDMSKQGVKHVLQTLVANLKFGSVISAVPVEKIRPGVLVSHQVQDAQGNVRIMSLRVTAITPKSQVDPDTGGEVVGSYELTLQGVESPITVPNKGQVPVVFTMKEMGIDFPVVYSESPINRTFKVPNPNIECRKGWGIQEPAWGAAGMLGGPGGMLGSSGAGGGMMPPAGDAGGSPARDRGSPGRMAKKEPSPAEPLLDRASVRFRGAIRLAGNTAHRAARETDRRLGTGKTEDGRTGR